MTGVENGLDLAHQHLAVRARAEMIELRANVDERPGELHGVIIRAESRTWFWTCHLCVEDRAGYDTDAQAWTAFLEHEEEAHTTLAPIVSLDDWRTRHAG